MTGPRDRVAAVALARGRRAGDAVRGAPAEPRAAKPALSRGVRGERAAAMFERLFAATEKAILESGVDHISMIDVCHSAGISRGTFYRNFASLAELLDAYVQYRREVFRLALAARIEPFRDPRSRLYAALDYLGSSLSSGRPRQLLLSAPEFALVVYRRLFRDAMVRFHDLLAPVMREWNVQLEAELDRDLICELLIRFAMSEALVGPGADLQAVPARVARMVEMLRLGSRQR